MFLFRNNHQRLVMFLNRNNPALRNTSSHNPQPQHCATLHLLTSLSQQCKSYLSQHCHLLICNTASLQHCKSFASLQIFSQYSITADADALTAETTFGQSEPTSQIFFYSPLDNHVQAHQKIEDSNKSRGGHLQPTSNWWGVLYPTAVCQSRLSLSNSGEGNIIGHWCWSQGKPPRLHRYYTSWTGEV